MSSRWKGRIAFATILPVLVFALSAYGGEKEIKKFEILLSAGSSSTASGTGFSPSAGFTFYLRKNLALSADFGISYHIPRIDFQEEFGIPVGEAERYVHIRIGKNYRLFSSVALEYSFPLSRRWKPFLTAGISWCRDYVDFKYTGSVMNDYIPYGAPVPYETDYTYRKSPNAPLMLLGGGIRCRTFNDQFIKFSLRNLGVGTDFATYQLIVSWGFRF